jgi:hypothetical protein
MIRKGIYTLEQLKKENLIDPFKREKNISILLYNGLQTSNYSDLFEKYSQVVLNRFNAKDNIIKRTYSNRFQEFDDLAIKQIRDQNFSQLGILDLAISDGRASIYFISTLIHEFSNLIYHGSDINLFYRVFKLNTSSYTYIVVDEKNKIIEITYPPFVWNIERNEGTLYFINNLLKRYIFKKYNNFFLKGKFKLSDNISILHSSYKTLIEQSDNMKVFSYSVLDPIQSRYNIIRAMNILHYGYFRYEQIESILNNIYSSLDEGGLLIEGSNEDIGSIVEGGIYRKAGNCFILVSQSTKPSRIQDQLLQFRPKSILK